MFALKFYALIQNYIGPNVTDWLNFIAYEEALKLG